MGSVAASGLVPHLSQIPFVDHAYNYIASALFPQLDHYGAL
jgi:hypothetical protein